MKTIFGIKKDLISYSFAAIILGSTSFVSIASTNSEAVFQTSGGINYVSGGVGDESIGRLNALSSNFDLKLVFAMNSGEFASAVRVVITDIKGVTILDTTSEGPWFFTRLPAGNYHVAATFAGKTVTHQAAVEPTKLRTVDFRWASE